MEKRMGRVFVVGDTHGMPRDTKKLNTKNFPEQKELTKEDVVIQLGDFAWIWYALGKNKEQEYWLDWLANKNYTLAVVLGNHENYDIIDTLPWTTKWDNAVQYYEIENGNKIYFFKRGAIYNINDKKILTIGGAHSIDIADRLPGLTWWRQEDINNKEIQYALDEIENDRKVDYVLTHTCPKRIAHHFVHGYDYTEKINCPTAKFLDEIDNLMEFKEWHFGHFHTDYELNDYGDIYRCHYVHPPYELK